MSDINKVIVTGRVTRNSELRQTPNGTSVTDVSVVSNRIWTKNGERQEDPTSEQEVVSAWDDQVTDWIDQDYNDNGIPDYMETELEFI